VDGVAGDIEVRPIAAGSIAGLELDVSK